MILSSADRGLRNPMTGTAACCARATTGDAAALPSPAMNSLRSISDLLRLDRQPIAVGAVCLALTQSFLQRGRPLMMLWTAPPPARQAPSMWVLLGHRMIRRSQMQTITTVGLYIAKSVFQVHRILRVFGHKMQIFGFEVTPQVTSPRPCGAVLRPVGYLVAPARKKHTSGLPPRRA